MGKKAGPTSEELEFIYNCLLRGLSDRAILDELEDESFDRRNLRFIAARRREFNTAKKVLGESIKKEFDPIVIAAKQKHFEDLVKVAESLLENSLSTVKENTEKDIYINGEYLIHDDIWGTKAVDRKFLKIKLETNIQQAEIIHGSGMIQSFVTHYENEYGGNKKFTQLIEEDPYLLISRFSLLANRKTFKGTCPICENFK